MSLRGIPIKAAVCAALLAGAGGAWATTTKTIQIDCTKGDSINEALADKSDGLVLEISGTCVEDVVVRRRNVTLRGTSPAADGIQAATPSNPTGAAVLLDDADGIVIENLTLSGGGRDGLTLQESGPTITVRDCRIEDNTFFGVAAFNSTAALEDVVVTGNGTPCSTNPNGGGIGIGSFAGSSLVCTGCTVTGNDGGESGCDIGAQASRASNATFQDSTISGDPAVLATTAARLFARDSTLIGNPFPDGSEYAAWAIQHGELTINGGEVAGSLNVDLKSALVIRRSLTTALPAQQTENNSGNSVTRDSMLDVAQGASLLGDTALDTFSQGFFRGGGTVGNLACNGNSDVVCRGGSVPAGSTCAGCPVPAPPCLPTAGAEYILSGAAGPTAGIFVDDFLRVFVNGVQVADITQGGHCCPPAAPIHFTADTGDSLRVQAQDGNECYSLDALWLRKADGSCATQLTGDISGPNCGAEPPGQIFFDQTSTLP